MTPLIWFAAAWAGPPFVTNDADPPDVGQWEIILPFTLKRAPDGSRSGEFVTVDVNYGYDRFTQLSVEVPIPYTREPGGGTRSGIGDLLLVYADLRYKWRAGDDGKSFWFLGTAVERPVSGRLELGAGLFAITPTAPGGKHNLGFNVGFKYATGSRSELLVSAERSLRGDPEFTLFVGAKLLTKPG